MSLILNRIEIALDTSGSVVGAFYQQYDTDRQVIGIATPLSLTDETTPALTAILGDALVQALATVNSLQAQLDALQSG